MTKDLIRRYIWLVDTINQAGEEGITYSRISEKWKANYLLSGGDEYAWRTFMNHKYWSLKNECSNFSETEEKLYVDRYQIVKPFSPISS